MRTITDQITLNTSNENVFKTLIAPTEICQWWQAKTAIVMAQTGGTWTASWGTNDDQPDYIVSATFSEFTPPSKLVLSNYRYYSKDGPLPFESDFETTFLVEEANGQTILKISQSGFPDDSEADTYYSGCVAGWRTTLENIQTFLSKRDS